MIAAGLLAFVGLGGAGSAAPQAAPQAAPLSGLAQQPDAVAACVRGDWESTGVTMAGREDIEVGGGDGVVLTIDEDGTMTADFTGMDRATFDGDLRDTTVRGFVEVRGEASGTVRTTEERDDAGTLEVADIDRQDVELTVVLTEPIDSRPLDRVPIDDLRRLGEEHGERGASEPMRPVTYACGEDLLTLTLGDQDRDADGRRDGAHRAPEITWTFERSTG